MSKYITFILLIGLSTSLLSQNSFSLSGGDELIGKVYPFELNDGTSIIVRTIGFEDMYKKYPYLQVIKVDDCGPYSHRTITSDTINSILNIYNVKQVGDELLILMEVYPVLAQHYSSEIGLLKVNIHSNKSEYRALRTINNMHNLDFKVLDNGNYAMYNFVSYTDVEAAYAIYILSPTFEILDYYEFDYKYYSISGNCKQIDDGWICTHGFTMIRLDQNLNPIWTMETKDRNTYWQLELEEDGFIVRSSVYVNFIRHMSLNKFDFDGNLVWRTTNLAKPDFSTNISSTSKLLKRDDTNYDMVVSFNDYSNQVSKLYYYLIDSKNGDILQHYQITPNNTSANFVFEKYSKINEDTYQIIVSDYDNNHQVIRYQNTNHTCISLDYLDSILDAAPIEFYRINNAPKREINYFIGSYSWQFIDRTLEFGTSCEFIYDFEDLTPKDTIACSELGFIVNLSKIKFPIYWNDGDTSKIRTFLEAGSYSYRTNYCDQEFEASFNLTLEKCTCDFEIANIFSPNGDDLNDEIKLNNQCDYLTDFQFLVYDRSGSLLFQTKAPEFSWDGKFNGQKLNNGVYTYVMQYKNSLQNNKLIQKSGTITIAK